MTFRKFCAYIIIGIALLPLTVMVGLCYLLTYPLRLAATFVRWAEDELTRDNA